MASMHSSRLISVHSPSIWHQCTHLVLFRFTRLQYGINAAGESFPHRETQKRRHHRKSVRKSTHSMGLVSPVVVVPKSDGTVRLCMDMRMANQAIQRVRHLIPTVEDISLDLNQAKYFTKLDLSQAYHQLLLDEQSRFITTFSTHLGLFRYTHLPYGINALISSYFGTPAFHMASVHSSCLISVHPPSIWHQCTHLILFWHTSLPYCINALI